MGKAAFLRDKGVQAVGRYYRVRRPERAITVSEARELSSAGLRIIAVYEDTGQAKEFPLTKLYGAFAGQAAIMQAHDIGQPRGGVIYFAVEGLPHGYTIVHLPGIRDFFVGVKESIGDEYRLGVYGDGIVCSTMLEEGVCTHTWLAAASTSFEGTVAFDATRRWNLAQRQVDQKDGWDGISVDLDEATGDFGGFLVPVVLA